ncbi:molybdenum cofactor guanylyltransferase [Synoicihabitans lomoniglobus]|uniref:Molybdenum cofactor guanylyltransferase n=1 Tax=Synoicihabitans lomoniglobus TaxID=2909285 RepID=A0AAE9ZW35_9BACT|nr:molybdenum cofactor guanylyltransferase [Opitutaceae bacterium LMO-M01]WED65311.1 molybdenum cofactor guanylyltransferase [Opitutaceae bacterium LMO-M01]
MSTAPIDFSAVVLAGGHSRRMGTDKAALRHPRDGQSLLQHQLGLLASLEPVECFVSARHDQTLPTLTAPPPRIDDDGTAGPLGGIVGTFAQATTAHLLVIAVDLPFLDAATLQRLRGACTATTGAIARSPHGIEPLVAIYPRIAIDPLRHALHAQQLGLQRLLQAPALAPHFHLVECADATVFRNWNAPDDL